MSSWLIILVGIIYLYVGFDLIIRGNAGLGIAFLGYALSNIGLYYASLS